MNIRKVKILLSLLSIFIAIAPIVYALYSHNWNMSSLITPNYSPPKINFSLGSGSVRVQDGSLYIVFELRNTGELAIDIEGIEGKLSQPDGSKISDVRLVNPVRSEPDSVKDITLCVELDRETLWKTLPRLRGNEDIVLKIEGVSTLRVLGTKATAPFTVPITLRRSDLLGLASG